MIDKWLGQHINSLDADIFTGDCLFEKENRNHLQYFINRWLKEIKTYDNQDEQNE